MSLKQMLERFREYENELWYSRSLCVMPVDKYYVFYIPDVENAVVIVIQ